MSFRAFSPCLAAIILIGCGGGGSSSGGLTQSALAPPENMKVSTAPNNSGTPSRAVIIQWTQPTEAVDGYVVEMRQGSGDFKKITPSPILALYDLFTFDPSMPEDTDLGFRVFGVIGSAQTTYSSVVPYHLGIIQPGQPLVSYDIDAGGVRLSWARNTSIGDALKIERAPCNYDGTTSGSWTSLPVTDPLASTFLDTSALDGTRIHYRVTNLHLAKESPQSLSSLPIVPGFWGPSSVSAHSVNPSVGINVSWSTTSQSIDGILIERCQGDSAGNPAGPWSTVAAIGASETSWMDTAWIEASYNLYRVSYLHGAHQSIPTQSNFEYLSLYPPTGFQIVPITGGLRLSWQNHSPSATRILIKRSNGSQETTIAVLPETETIFDDLAIPALGYYAYRVFIDSGTNTPAAATDYLVAATPSPIGGLSLVATSLDLPNAQDAALRPDGTWALGTMSPFGILSTNAPWPADFPQGAVYPSTPFLQVDNQDHPHAFFQVPDPDDSSLLNLTHAWFDGISWQQDRLGGAAADASNFSAALDNSGTPEILFDERTLSRNMSTDTVHFIHEVAGTWSDESLASLGISNSYLNSFSLSLDPYGAPHFLLRVNNNSLQNVHVIQQNGHGGWTDSSLSMSVTSDISGHWKDANNATIFYESSPLGFWAAQEISGVWQSPVQISSDTYYAESIGSAHSADGSRVVAFRNTALGLKIYSQDGLGAWHETLIPNASGYYLIRIGVDGANKVHVLVEPSKGVYIDYHE